MCLIIIIVIYSFEERERDSDRIFDGIISIINSIIISAIIVRIEQLF